MAEPEDLHDQDESRKSPPIEPVHSTDPYTHVIITRFSYRFTKDQPIGNLFDPTRMQRRFQLFESFCLPSICDQIYTNFYWILVVDKAIPEEYLDRLNRLIAKFYQSPEYETRGPRQIIVHKWTYRFGSLNVGWLRDIGIPLDKKYLITSRMDDDDAISSNFTALVKDQFYEKTIRGFYLVSFESGYYWYPNKSAPYGFYRSCTRPLVAIGLTLIVDHKKYPMTAYFGNHTKLIKYIKNYKSHKGLKKLCERNKEPITGNYAEKYALINDVGPVFIRTVHDQHLQRGMQNHFKNTKVADFSSSIRKCFKLNFPHVGIMNRQFFGHSVTPASRPALSKKAAKHTDIPQEIATAPLINPVYRDIPTYNPPLIAPFYNETTPSQTTPSQISLTDL